MSDTQADPIQNRHDFVLLFDVEQGNPNGDPDAGNQARLDPQTGRGLVTDVCLKRKIRDYVALREEFKPPFNIYVKHRGILANEQRSAFQAIGAEPSEAPNLEARAWMCRNYFDVRTFGAVMTTGKAPTAGIDASAKKEKKKLWNCGQVRGPVQLTFASSIDPVLPLEHSITRVALTNADDTGRDSSETAGGEEKAGSGQMARKNAIPYGLYRAHGFVSASLAADTGFNKKDLETLWEAIVNMFEHDRSAARGQMTTRRLFIFEHDSRLGNAPAHVLFDKVTVTRKDQKTPARSFGDYSVSISKDLPQGVKLIERP